MSSTNHYDQALLAATPAATKAQLQEGYNPYLLDDVRHKQGALPLLPPPQRDSEQGHASKEHLGHVAPPVPFWRSTKGRVIMFVATVVVIGAVVGGAVGGTVGKRNGAASSSDSSQQPAGFEPATQGISPISTGEPNSSTSTTTTAIPVGSDTVISAAPDQGVATGAGSPASQAIELSQALGFPTQVPR